MGNFCSCYEELLVEDELPPIVFFDLEDLKKKGTTPRSPEDKHLHRKYDDIDRTIQCLSSSVIAGNVDIKEHQGTMEDHIQTLPTMIN